MSHTFRFRLQRVLDLREQRERDCARELTDARAEAEAAERARRALEAAREAGLVRLNRAHGAGGAVGHMRNLAFMVSRLEERIRDADEVCRAAHDQVTASLEQYEQTLRDRKVIDKLRDRMLDRWRVEGLRTEQKEMDEIALTLRGASGGSLVPEPGT